MTDANGVATTLAYTPRGWLASRSVGGETTTYAYDNVGNLTRVTLPDGAWVAYAYDAANGLTGIDDSLGNSIDYELDVMGNRIQEVVRDPQGALKRTLQRVYDGNNRLERELGAAGQTTRYVRDNHGNATSVTDPLSRVTTHTYDSLGGRELGVLDRLQPVLRVVCENRIPVGRILDVGEPVATQYTYDGLGNLEQQLSPDTGTTSFTHDAAGNVATQTDARGVTTTYTYDALNRVTAATVAGTKSQNGTILAPCG